MAKMREVKRTKKVTSAVVSRTYQENGVTITLCKPKAAPKQITARGK